MSYITKSNKLDMILDHAAEYASSKYYFKKHCFIKYTIGAHKVFLNDIYVEPEHRDSKVATEIISDFKEHMEALGIKEVLTTVYKDCVDKKISMHLAKSFGMSVYIEDEDRTIFWKEL